jgi:hypothetical protein
MNKRIVGLLLLVGAGSVAGCSVLGTLLTKSRPAGKGCESYYAIVRKPIGGGGVAEIHDWARSGGGESFYAECPANPTVDPDALYAWKMSPFGVMHADGTKAVPIASKAVREWDDWLDVNGKNVQFHFTGTGFYTKGCVFWVKGNCDPAGAEKPTSN